ncbi:Pkinase-domain-containing protein [Daedalea quercina L-15889]|uniref:Pkinase-domain-containing protein n=1 Tax=Daedalea quercina L-15889 TaxID=1314783 RepID=A0A165QUR2_9APHY|nr:Pkinase-domain-containing protein [Daedalea quercina L-15889]
MSTMASTAPDSPPRAPPVKYHTPLGTRWQKEKAAAGSGAFDFPDDAKYVGPWIIGECVGKGASGHVKIAKHRRTGQLAAVKILPLQPFVKNRADAAAQAKLDKQRLGIDREITMMKLMNHPNIMRIYDVYEGEKELYLILEYVEGGELFDFLVNRGKLAPLEALAYFKQVVYGLNYAHTFSIIHRDLKPENILIHSLNPPLIKIADWGMAAFAPPSLQLETSCGSPHYASPEIVNGHKYTGTATDIWSCGVILYALLTGRLPFDDKNVRTLLSKVKVGKYEMPTYIDPMAKDLLTRMLVVDVNKRISMTEVLAHPWLEGLTPGITYVPAPPVSELAKPLPSALHIDRDLFESLCVIWGRHADVDGIRTDLLSPPGQGTLAKAFYFLLQKHRERTMEEHGIFMDIDEVLTGTGKVVMKQYSTPSSRRSTHLEPQDLNRQVISQHQFLQSTRAAPTPPSRISSPKPAALVVSTDVPMERAPSRAHPPSPVGPRPQKARPSSAVSPPVARPQSSFAAPIRQVFQTAVAGTNSAQPASQANAQSLFLPYQPRPPAPMRRGSAPIAVPRASAMSSSSNDPAGAVGYRASVATPLHSSIHSPIPVRAAVSPILPMVTAPRVQDAGLQRNLDNYAKMVNMQATSWNAARPSAPPPTEVNVPEPMDVTDVPTQIEQRLVTTQPCGDSNEAQCGMVVDDKENWDARTSHTRSHSHANAGGLGFGQSVPMAKEMGNIVFFSEPQAAKAPRKDRRSRTSTLDLHGTPVLHKRSTFSVVGSPGLMSPQSSMIGSPAGEFKGWFSNLFHWKVQSFTLYSTTDLLTTRTEIARLLEQCGVLSMVEDHHSWYTLKCSTADSQEVPSGAYKQVRFRVDFASAGQQYASPSSATPRLSQSGLPVPSSSFGGSRLRTDKFFGYETGVALVLEKGSVSTFKAICQRVRAEWRLDAMQSPRGTGAPVGYTPSIEQRFSA